MMAYRDRARGEARWVLLAALALAGACAFAACKGESQNGSSGQAGAASGTGTGGAGGGTMTTSSGGGDAPLTCTVPYTDVTTDECDLLQQDCPPGLTCRPINTANGWRTKCRGNTGLKGPGKSCVFEEECEAGLFCIGEPNGWCAPACCPASNEPCGGGSCNVSVDIGGAFVMMCSFAPECEILTANACDNGQECHISDANQGLATCIAPSANQVGEGEACTFLNDCMDMQHCLPPPDSICRYYCFVGGDPGLPPGLGGCPANQSCMAAGLGVPGVGICSP